MLTSPDATDWFIEKAQHVFETGESSVNENKRIEDGRYLLLPKYVLYRPGKHYFTGFMKKWYRDVNGNISPRWYISSGIWAD